MTRDMALALAKQIDTEPYIDAQELVYIIYDAFESRTCSSCKYYQKNIEAFGEYKGECTNLIIYDSDLGTVPHGFLCNEWEKKDDYSIGTDDAGEVIDSMIRDEILKGK